jgi:hypothetical protein
MDSDPCAALDLDSSSHSVARAYISAQRRRVGGLDYSAEAAIAPGSVLALRMERARAGRNGWRSCAR